MAHFSASPPPLKRVRRAQADLRRSARRAALLTGRPAAGSIRLLYGLLRMPTLDQQAWGGGPIHMLHLMRRFEPAWRDFNVFHLASSALGLVPDARELAAIARRRGAPIVLNQDGIEASPFHPSELRELDVELIRSADHVIFQSRFCRDAVEDAVGGRDGSWEILHNGVDVDRFSPPAAEPSGPPTLLLAGNQVQPYRLRLAVQTLRHVVDAIPDARLLVAGMVRFPEDDLIGALGLRAHVEYVGRHSIREAPDVYRRAHVLLHPRVDDPCPNAVLEALASGLPVVHTASGGVPELVGDAGVGVPVEHRSDELALPQPEALAAAAVEVLGRRAELAPRARARAVEQFPLERWLDRYDTLLTRLVLEGG